MTTHTNIALGLQPLETFVIAAREQNPENKLAALNFIKRDAEKGQAWMKLAPVLSVVGGPTQNQYATEITLPNPQSGQRTITTLPKDQKTLSAAVHLPLVDMESWKKIAAAKASLEASGAQRAAINLEIDKSIFRAYYQLVVAKATIEATDRAIQVANDTLKTALNRQSSGVASSLDTIRAKAEVDRAKQVGAEASYNLAVAKRNLQTLSGITPEEGSIDITDDLHAEGSLAEWEARLTPDLPAIAAARLDRIAAEKTKAAASAAYLPTVIGNVTQTYTNAAGLSGHESYYSLGLSLNWRLDPGTPYSVDGQAANLKIAAIREERAMIDAKDRVYLTWEQVRFQIAKSRASRAQDQAHREALLLMLQRYSAGTATLLEVSLAERDSLTAAVNRIQADGDLAYARALLRLETGKPLASKAPLKSTNKSIETGK